MDLLALDSLPLDLRGAIATRDLASDQVLFRQGDSATNLFIVKTGRLKVIYPSSECRSLTLYIARPSESLGEAALALDIYPYTAIAEIASQVMVYPKLLLLLALERHPSLITDLMARLIRKNLALIRQLELRDIRASHRRVLRYLRHLTESEAVQQLNFDRPLKEIAVDLGLAPATLSRALTRLEREGRIVRERNFIQLQDSSTP